MDDQLIDDQLIDEQWADSAGCIWKHEENYGETDYWDTSCGNAFHIVDGTPADNQMVYCPYCGKLIKLIEEAEK